MPPFLPAKLPFLLALTFIFCGFAMLFWIGFSASQRPHETTETADATSRDALLDTMRRENNRLRQAVEGAADSLNASSDEVKTALQSFSLLQEQIRELRKERAGLQTATENWQNRTINYLRDLDRASRNDGVSDSARATMRKDFDELARELAPLGFFVIRPEPNSIFDDRLHQSVSTENASGIGNHRILRCERFGFQISDRVVSKAEVVVAGN